MSAFAAITARKPPRTLTIPLTAFADDWEERPTEPVVVGLRRCGLDAATAARAEAMRASARQVGGDSPEVFEEAFNDVLMRVLVARCTCAVSDVMQPAPVWGPLPEDAVYVGLTPEGARYIFDAVERMSIETSPVQTEASDEDIAALPGVLAARLGELSPEAALRIRKLLGFVLDELTLAPPTHP